jgi:hypothetical protein
MEKLLTKRFVPAMLLAAAAISFADGEYAKGMVLVGFAALIVAPPVRRLA